MYASLKKLLWSWLSLKFIIATNNLLLSSDRLITELACTTAHLAVKLWQSDDKLYIWLCILFILFYLEPARHVHVREEMDVCIWSPTRSSPRAGDVDDVLRWTMGLVLPRTQTKCLIPIQLSPLHTHGVQPSYNKAKLSRLIASWMTYSTWAKKSQITFSCENKQVGSKSS